MQDRIRLLVQLQNTDTLLLQKRRFIDRIPLRISEVDGALKKAVADMETFRQKAESAVQKKKDKDRALEDVQEKIKKLKARTPDIKTNKEYQAHLKEIESSEKEIKSIEEQILNVMNEVDLAQKNLKEAASAVAIEEEKIKSVKKELEKEAEVHEQELGRLKDDRAKMVGHIDADTYNNYLKLLMNGKGLAVAPLQDDICRGCDMNVPPQLSLELKKSTDLVQCPHCHRILYCEDK